jgi:hypothetical protein
MREKKQLPQNKDIKEKVLAWETQRTSLIIKEVLDQQII